MPKQIQTSEQFEKLLSKAQQLRVSRQDDSVKLKLRTPDYLYVYKTSADEAEDLIKSAKDIEVVEFNPKKESDKDKEAEAKKKESEKAAADTKSKKKKKSSQSD